jgi:hypothetical protein
MKLLKFTNMAPDFYPSSRRINGSILEYVPIGATKKMGKKTSHVVNFIVSMALSRGSNHVRGCLNSITKLNYRPMRGQSLGPGKYPDTRS